MTGALHTPGDYRVLYVDMNAFYASLAQQANPELRGKPVGVSSYAHNRGSILASSYEAKAFGIKTGMRVAEAKQLCPGIIIQAVDFSVCSAGHKAFKAILFDLCGEQHVIMKSVDEAAIYLAPNEQSDTVSRALAQRIKSTITSRMGECIRCSIGIAPNTILAKLGTDLQKPNGLVIFTLAQLRDQLGAVPITALAGIAERNASRLSARGITNPVELYDSHPADLRRWFGIWGQHWWWRLHGYEVDDARHQSYKMLSHEHVLHHWIASRGEGDRMVAHLAEELIHRLVRNGYQTEQLWLSVRFDGFPRFETSQTLDGPTRTHSDLLHYFMNLYHQLPPELPASIRKLALGFGRLSRTNDLQLTLFHDALRTSRLTDTITHIRLRHGERSIGTAAGWKVSTHKPKQPGFGRIRDI